MKVKQETALWDPGGTARASAAHRPLSSERGWQTMGNETFEWFGEY